MKGIKAGPQFHLLGNRKGQVTAIEDSSNHICSLSTPLHSGEFLQDMPGKLHYASCQICPFRIGRVTV